MMNDQFDMDLFEKTYESIFKKLPTDNIRTDFEVFYKRVNELKDKNQNPIQFLLENDLDSGNTNYHLFQKFYSSYLHVISRKNHKPDDLINIPSFSRHKPFKRKSKKSLFTLKNLLLPVVIPTLVVLGGIGAYQFEGTKSFVPKIYDQIKDRPYVRPKESVEGNDSNLPGQINIPMNTNTVISIEDRIISESNKDNL